MFRGNSPLSSCLVGVCVFLHTDGPSWSDAYMDLAIGGGIQLEFRLNTFGQLENLMLKERVAEGHRSEAELSPRP